MGEIATVRRWRSHSGGAAHLNTFCDGVPFGRPMFIAAEVGGVLRSDDAGASWTDITENLDPDVHKILLDPLCAGGLYAATGTGVFQLGPRGMEWQNLGPRDFPYVQALAFHPATKELYISAALAPYGRRRSGRYAGTNEWNKFAILSVAQGAHSWRRLRTSGRRLAGVLSKALTIEPRPPHDLFAGAIDGCIYRVDDDGVLSVIADGFEHIECIETIQL